MERFLSDLVHDLRNLLEGMEVTLFQGGNVDPEMRDVVYREVSGLARKVEDYREFSRLRHGRVELRGAPLPIAAVGRASMQGLGPFLRKRKTSCRFEPEGIVARGDRGAVERIVGSMIHSAARVTRDGDPISLEAISSNARVTLRVGFPLAPGGAAAIERLFTLGDEGGGGLGIARELARLQGGDLNWNHGAGSARIELTLPAEEEARREDEPAAGGAGTSGGPNKLSILVVDDRVDSAKSLAMLLSLAGHDTEVRHDGRSALEAVRSSAPDVVLLDIGLPDMDGYEVCRAIRKAENRRPLLLVAVSGRGDDESRTESLEAGFDAHLVKPIDGEELRSLLDRAR
jgi:CheY-like chemotaxis protein